MYIEPLINNLFKGPKNEGKKRIRKTKQKVLTLLEVARTPVPILKLIVGRK